MARYQPEQIGGGSSLLSAAPQRRVGRSVAPAIEQLSNQTSGLLLQLAQQTTARAEATEYATAITDTSQGLATIQANTSDPKNYLEKSTSYVKGVAEGLSGEAKDKFLFSTGRAINSAFVKKSTRFTKEQDQIATQALSDAGTGLLQQAKSLASPQNEEDAKLYDTLVGGLYEVLTLQENQERSRVPEEMVPVNAAISLKYQAKRQNIIQELGLAKLTSYMQSQDNPYGVVRDLMQGDSKLAGYEHLTPETLAKAALTAGQLNNANIQAENRDKQIIKEQKERVLLGYGQEYLDPNTTDARRDEIDDNVMSLAPSAKDLNDMQELKDQWVKRNDAEYNTDNPRKVNVANTLADAGEYDAAEQYLDDNFRQGISIKAREAVKDRIKKRKGGLYSHQAMKDLRKTLNSIAPLKETFANIWYAMNTGQAVDAGDQENAELQQGFDATMTSLIESGEISNYTQLQDMGTKLIAQTKEMVRAREEAKANDALVQRYSRQYRGDPNAFKDAVIDGKITNLTKEQQLSIILKLIEGAKDE